jgi:hypothetical protein
MKKLLKFGFDVSTLGNYTDQESTQLILRSFFANKTYAVSRANGADLETGIKSSKAIQKFSLTAVPQTYSTCGFNASGNAPFTQVVLTPGKIKYQDILCPKQLEAKWTQKLLTQGQNQDENKLTFVDDIENALISLIKEHTEVMDWQGDILSGNEFINKYDGLIKNIDASTLAVNGNTGNLNSITSSNAVGAIMAMADALPAKLKGKEDLILYVGTDTFDKIVTNMFTLNLYNYVAETGNYELTIPGKGIKCIGVHGLDSTDRMFLMRASNITYGTDMEGEDEEFDLWYSKDDDNIKYSVKFSRGVVCAYYDEIVEFTKI